ADGSKCKADGQLAGTPSQIFDAVAIVVSDEGCAALKKEAAAVQFVMDAFGHLKAIGATAAAKPLLDKAGVEPDAGVTGLDDAFVSAAKRRFYDREPQVRTLA
ncbi:MAG: catalase HPII, partial [Sphingomonadales bacterium]|nr:catalase HPII [Sphingomonadales bacterium]